MRVFVSMLMILCWQISICQVQEKKGWVKVFDGSSVSGWRGYNRADAPGAWTVEDGALKINRKSSKDKWHADRGDLIYPVKYQNFELKLEYKVAKGSNSGILYLVTEIPNKLIYHSAPEFQILDNENHPDAKRGKNGNRQAGSLYDLIAANPQVSKPYDTWNSVRIVVKKGHVEHYLNGKKVVKYQLWGEDWKSLVAESKFKSWNEFLMPGGSTQSGYIALQDHHDDVWFRNIRIKKL